MRRSYLNALNALAASVVATGTCLHVQGVQIWGTGSLKNV